ncbi:hypothetical protein WH47_09161 [Habropoda laboriosa]|uniref:Uncharacterized protein n=1 Tax=Habropoda laboriosa TaxID=597456 RepID=A0A0L7QMY2_9HYME|nr:hypothetical protein WH47_09161 [Habropoda laboriosa]
MTAGTNNTCGKWSMEERENILTSGTLEEKKEAFKDDEELMRETTKFVNDVIQTASTEATKRKVYSEKGDANEGKMCVCVGSRLKGIAGWNRRVREFCSRVLNVLCLCFNNNGKS